MLFGSGEDSFAVLGEGAVGVVFGSGYGSTVGLASVIFTPLMSQTGQSVPTVVTPEGDIICYPNPFNPDLPESITIAYKLPQDVLVKVYIFDITGQIVRTILAYSSSRGADGFSRVSWDGRSGFGEVVGNGVYLVRIVQDNKTLARTKIMVLK